MKTVSMRIGNKSVLLMGYIHDPHYSMPDYEKRPAVLVLGGGGYEFVAMREREPAAAAFYAKGYQAFTLIYSTEDDATDMQPMYEAALAIKLMRENCGEWCILPDKIAVCGFSAGGHLAGCTGILADNEQLLEKVGVSSADEIRSNAMILCYSVITSGEFAHRGSIERLTGKERFDELKDIYSLEKHVTKNTPPTFIWHTVDDACVPVENSLLMMSALQRFKIPFEAHLFETGMHGMSMCTNEVGWDKPHCRHWFELCTEWLNARFEFRS